MWPFALVCAIFEHMCGTSGCHEYIGIGDCTIFKHMGSHNCMSPKVQACSLCSHDLVEGLDHLIRVLPQRLEEEGHFRRGVSSRKLSYQGPTSGPGVPRDLLVHVGGFDASGARLPLRVAMMMFSRFSAEAAVRGIGLVTTPQVGCLGQIGTQQPDTQALV
jgi:hypothetical protein